VRAHVDGDESQRLKREVHLVCGRVPDEPNPSTARQTRVIAIGRLAAAGLSAAWFFVAARALTLSQFSDLALVLAVGSALFFLTDAGYSTLFSSHAGRVGCLQPAALSLTIRYRLCGCLIAVAILVPAFLVAASDPSPLVPLVFAGSMVGNAVHGSVAAGLRGLGHSGVEAANEVVSRALILIVGWSLLASGGGVLAAAAVYAAADLVSGLALAAYAARWVRCHPAPLEPALDLHWRRSMPIAVGAGFATVYGRIDTWLVALLAPPGSAGLYAAAYRLTEFMRIPAQAAGAVALTAAERPDGSSGADSFRLARRYAVLAGVAAAVLAAFAGPVMTILFGEEFGAGASILRVLAVASVASCVVSVLAPTAAVLSGRAWAISVAAVLLLNLVANLVLLPALGGVGAAWADVLSESALAGLLYLLVSSQRGFSKT
jgi:O-antigen/teichoic acid export membrane protein